MNASDEIIEKGVVVIEGARIVAVGHDALMSDYEFEEMIDAHGGIIMPGFINGHGHVSMSIFRTLGEDIPNRLQRFLFPLEDRLICEEYVRKGAMLGIAEMILGGVTTFVDMYYFEDEVAKAAKEMGIRAIVGETIIDRIAPDAQLPYEGMIHAKRLIEKWRGDEWITPALAPHATYSNDEAHLKEICEISKELDVPVLMHVSEMTYEISKFREAYQMSPVQYLDHIGVLNDKLIAAHVVYADEADLELLAKHDVGVVHCVAANAKSGRPVSPVDEMLKHGVMTGIGTDGPMSGNTLDVIGLLDQVTKVQKINAQDNTVLTAREVVEMGTILGAKAIHMADQIGSLEVGKMADVIIIDTSRPHLQPIYDYYSALVYGAYPQDVVFSMIHGQIVMKDRKLLTGDLAQIIKAVQKISGKIKAEMVEM
ncbi:amidohydrolase [Fusibacter sp. Q10-2]|uniref:Amidohydrolase n=2 Tax=Fusibacter ferrireducens TaxID=2785058 RepID=A0ABR9ZUY4_9FIRM|nr:amidohydrolase [Fusibacter ferrireducens]